MKTIIRPVKEFLMLGFNAVFFSSLFLSLMQLLMAVSY